MDLSNTGPWGMLLHEYSKGKYNIDRLAVSATTFSKALPYINNLSEHPAVSQYVHIPTITTEKVDACLNVTAEHFGFNGKWIITSKNSLLYNLTAFTYVSNLPTFAEKVANLEQVQKIVGEDVVKKLLIHYMPCTNVMTALNISDDPNRSVYNMQKHPDAECRNTLLASMAGQLFVFGVGNAVYLLLSTESGENLIRKWHNACSSKSPSEQSSTSNAITAAATQAASDPATNTQSDISKSPDETNKAKTAAELVATALAKPDDRVAVESTKEWVSLGSQIIAAAVACKVLPTLVKLMPISAPTA